MKIRIDSTTIDLEGQYVVHITRVADAEPFPVAPSGLCMVFKTKDEITALAAQTEEQPIADATKNMLKAWIAVDPTLSDLTKAAGKTSEDLKLPKGI